MSAAGTTDSNGSVEARRGDPDDSRYGGMKRETDCGVVEGKSTHTG